MTSHHMWHQRVQDRLVSVWVWNDRWVVSTQAITLSAPCPRNRPTDVSWTLIVYGWAVYGFMCVPGAIGATGSGTRFIHGCSYELSIGCLYMEPKVRVVPREISMEMFKECSTMHVSAHTKPVWNLNKDSPWKQIFSHYYWDRWRL